MVAQAEPVYSALPWALIKFALQCAVGEDETYHTMLTGTELVSELLCQYPALEQLYAKIDSELSQKLRKSLIRLYKAILQFQVHAINYFHPKSKVKRSLAGFNPVTADEIKQLREEIHDMKHQVDGDAALVSFEISKHGIDGLKEGQHGQDQQLEAIKDGIRALAGKTGQAIRDLSQEQQNLQDRRNDMLISMWKGPMDEVLAKLKGQAIEKARENLQRVRAWLSLARPGHDLLAARERRSMRLGDWLLAHQRFQTFRDAEHSEMLWLYGFTGTGKTGLVCRVINELESGIRNIGRIAFFFCSKDNASPTGEETFSRSDADEALRSLVSQLATSHEGNYVAPFLQDKYDDLGPDRDHSMRLASQDCIEILLTVSKEMPSKCCLSWHASQRRSIPFRTSRRSSNGQKCLRTSGNLADLRDPLQ